MAGISFRGHYSLQQWAVYTKVDAELAAQYELADGSEPSKTPEGRAILKAWLAAMDEIDGALGNYLAAMATEGRLEPVPFAEGRRNRWADGWNAMLRGKASLQWDWKRLASGMALEVLSGPARIRHRKEPENLAESYERFIDLADAGGKYWRPQDASYDCDATGARLVARFSEGWKPVLLRQSYDENSRTRLEPITEPAPAPAVQQVEIPTPSGELLMADWFRIPGFSQVVDPKGQDHPSINTTFGRHAQSLRYAKLGFTSISTGNCFPEVYERNGQIVIAETDPEVGAGDVPGRLKGSVCCDLWWLTIIDREVLTALLAEQAGHGREKAERLVADYIAETGTNMVTVQAPAGCTLKVYFEYRRGLLRGFESPEVDTSDLDILYAVVSQRPLQWMPKAAEAARQAEVAVAHSDTPAPLSHPAPRG